MPTTGANESSGGQGRRIVGLWMVALAVTLAVLGIGLAVRQAQTLSKRLMNQARDRAAYIAEEARRQLNEEVGAALRTVSREMAERGIGAWTPSNDLPGWIDGVFAWDGTKIIAAAEPASGSAQLARLIESRFARRPAEHSVDSPRPSPQFLYETLDETPVVIGALLVNEAGGPRAVAINLELPKLRDELIAPLLAGNDGLELVARDGQEGSRQWFQVMDGAARPWVIRPTEAFLREQRLSVMGQTLAYLGLTVLALATLLAAIVIVVRVARREMALAEMKSNFVADVSHELKTPLAAIRLFAETLQAGRVASEEKRQEYYAIISRESERLTHLIDNILDFARIDAGRREYTLEARDIGEIVRELYDTYSVQLDHNGFEHSLTIADGLPRAEVDKDAIAQVLVNLMTNAVKYSDDDKYLAIDVAEDTRRDRRGVLISVQDRGIGIKPEDRARLTEGFFRAADGRVRQKGGTGLGLALVKHIVEAHNGTLEVEPRLVKGSTFRVFFPAARDSERR